ncbi:MAG: type I restriction enzyme HsdR N-terminal domain-containing protein [Ferruginibacter sp.]
MIKIEYPPYNPRIKKENGRELIFDEIRKRWVVLTPEEWVRQNFLAYLVQVRAIPSSLIAVEKEIVLGDIKKRFDIVIYNQQAKPFMLVECKEMGVALTPKVLDQALRYNIAMQVPFVVITNGQYCMAFDCSNGVATELTELPPVNPVN